MRKITVFFLVMLMAYFVFPEFVSFEDARMIAQNWTYVLRDHFNDRVSVFSGEPVVRDGIKVAYVFHFLPRGYVVVSARDYLPPVKLYSLNRNFGEEGKMLEDSIFSQYAKIITLVQASLADPLECFGEINRSDFAFLRRHYLGSMPGSRGKPRESEEIKPLLTTTWHQGEPFNLKCPVVNGKRSYAGCVPVSFAQVMKYYEYPDAGQRAWGYWTRTHKIPIEVYYGHPYHWNLMLDDYPGPDSGTDDQQEAVARLLFDVGVALETDFSPEGSAAAAYRSVIAFPLLFKYARDIMYVNRAGWQAPEWFNMAKDRLEQGIPVPMGIVREGGGHMVVVDGYRVSAGAATFHLNLGWGGAWDGYYSLDNITAADRFYTLLDEQCYVLNMVPPESGIAVLAPECGGIAHENRGLFLKEYYCELTWKAHPAGPETIDRYDIISYDNKWGLYSKVAEIDHTRQSGFYRYTFRVSDYTSHAYIILSVDHERNERIRLLSYLSLEN